MAKLLEGKKAVVTGASSGIGRAIALKFAAEGAELALLARREKNLYELKHEIISLGGKAHVCVVDVSDVSQCKKVFKSIKKKIGDPNILVNNAGTGFWGSVADSTLEEYEKTFNTNVRAMYVAIKEVLPGMIKNQEGTIINIGSIRSKVAEANSAIYSASKFAVSGFSEAIQEELRPYNIRVSVIYPAKVHTELFGRKSSFYGKIENYIQSEDVAQAALLCVSNTQSASYTEIVIRPRRPI